MTRARRRRPLRPSAASRTLCLLCRREGCRGGSCLATPVPATVTNGTLILDAVDRVGALVAGLGLHPMSAARLVARRMVVPERELLDRLRDLRRPSAWWEGSLARPTARPIRGPRTPGDTETTDHRGAA